MKSKWTRSLMSTELSMTTTRPRLVRWISGMAVSSSLVQVKSSEKSASSRALATCGAFMKIYVNMKAFGT